MRVVFARCRRGTRNLPALAVLIASLPGAALAADTLSLRPLAVDWREAQSPVRDQADRGTCTAFGLMAMLETLPGMPADLSEQWAYGQTKLRVYNGKDDEPYIEGTELTNYLHTLRWTGVQAEHQMPYNPAAPIWSDETPSREKFEADLAGAKLFDLLSFSRWTWKIPGPNLVMRPGAEAKDVAWIKQQLASGAKAVAVGYFTPMPYWSEYRGRKPMNPEDCVEVIEGDTTLTWKEARTRYGESLFQRLDAGDSEAETKDPHRMRGGHVVAIVGYDTTGFLFKNSWGTDWGDHGYGRMTYDFHRLFADEACVATGTEFAPLKTTGSLDGFQPEAVRLKVVPVRSRTGQPAMSLSLVWHGPGKPVVWRKVAYIMASPKVEEVWREEVTADAATAPGFITGYPVVIEVGKHADAEFLVMIAAESLDGTKETFSYLGIRRRLGDHRSTTARSP